LGKIHAPDISKGTMAAIPLHGSELDYSHTGQFAPQDGR
jgi:hypothetical protein